AAAVPVDRAGRSRGAVTGRQRQHNERECDANGEGVAAPYHQLPSARNVRSVSDWLPMAVPASEFCLPTLTTSSVGGGALSVIQSNGRGAFFSHLSPHLRMFAAWFPLWLPFTGVAMFSSTVRMVSSTSLAVSTTFFPLSQVSLPSLTLSLNLPACSATN